MSISGVEFDDIIRREELRSEHMEFVRFYLDGFEPSSRADKSKLEKALQKWDSLRISLYNAYNKKLSERDVMEYLNAVKEIRKITETLPRESYFHENVSDKEWYKKHTFQIGALRAYDKLESTFEKILDDMRTGKGGKSSVSATEGNYLVQCAHCGRESF